MRAVLRHPKEGCHDIEEERQGQAGGEAWVDGRGRDEEGPHRKLPALRICYRAL